MRVLVLIIVTVFGIVASFFDAFYGLLLYTFYSFFHPLALVAYTSFKDYRTSYITALVVIFTAILQKKKIIISHKLTYLCLLFLCQCHLSLLVRNTGMSVASSFYISLLSNAIIITFITSALIEDFAKFKMYMTAAAVFLGFMGAYYGFFGVFAGATKIKGNMTGDNNAYAAWLNMSLPVIYYVGAVLKDKKWRFIFKIVFIGNILAVLLTLSRAGSITLCIVLAILVLQRMKKLLFFVIIPIGCIALFFFMPDYTAQNRDEGVNQEQDAKQDA
ncbi:MAG: hypothetical protein NTZ95_03665, partial [Candidatus Omnitrophica bacterium]|nr:hypothetical protein [Candidatus Omnitrophota bacterium]